MDSGLAGAGVYHGAIGFRHRNRLDNWLDAVTRHASEHLRPVAHRLGLTADDRLLTQDQAESSDHERLARRADEAELALGLHPRHVLIPRQVARDGTKMKPTRAALRNSSAPRLVMKCAALRSPCLLLVGCGTC